ncbi:MAG: methyltransferase family protein [Leptospirales bacterium]
MEAITSSSIFFFGVLIRMLGTGYIGKDTVWNSSLESKSIQFEGPYQFLRHPIYSGSLLILISLFPMCSLPGAVFLILFGGGFTVFLARYEEKMLGTLNPQYWPQMKQVPRFLPRHGFYGFLIKKGIPFTLKNWRITAASERYNLAFGIGFLCFSISFQKEVFWIGLILSFAILWIITSFQKKKGEPPP